MKNVPIHLLNAFYTFNNSANITAAAANLGVTQPALSKQLKSLEGKIPQAIFTMAGRRKALTPFGQELHQQLHKRLGGLQEILNQTSLIYLNPEFASVRLGARQGLIDRCCGKIHFPGTIEFVEATNQDIIDDLLKQEVQLGIVHTPPNSAELIAKVLFKEEFQLVIPKKYFKSRKLYGKSLFAELKDLPCIGFKKDDEILQLLCRDQSVLFTHLKMKRIAVNYPSILTMVNAGQGWAAIPAYLETSDDVWSLTIPKDVIGARDFYLMYRTELAQTLWMKDLIKEIRRCF